MRRSNSPEGQHPRTPRNTPSRKEKAVPSHCRSDFVVNLRNEMPRQVRPDSMTKDAASYGSLTGGGESGWERIGASGANHSRQKKGLGIELKVYRRFFSGMGADITPNGLYFQALCALRSTMSGCASRTDPQNTTKLFDEALSCPLC